MSGVGEGEGTTLLRSAVKMMETTGGRDSAGVIDEIRRQKGVFANIIESTKTMSSPFDKRRIVDAKILELGLNTDLFGREWDQFLKSLNMR